jgi:hypothetical protein
VAKKSVGRPSSDIPPEVLPKFEAITALTDAFCRDHLNDEYAEMCRRLATALAQKRPTPLKRGRENVWACGIVRTIGWANVLDDPQSRPYMKLIDIDPEFGVANSTGQGKSMAIKRMFGIGRLEPDWTLPSRLGENPVVWKVWVRGELVDIRQESREEQEKAFRKGLIPYIPADRQEQTAAPTAKPDMASLEDDLFGTLFGFHQRVMSLLRQSSLDEGRLKLAGDRIKQVIQNVTDEIKRTRQFNVAERFESAYEEVRRLIEDLSSEQDRSKE